MKNFLDARMKHQALIVNFRPRRRAIHGRAWSLIAVVGLLASLACVVPSFAQILGTAQLNVERRGHSATLLEDGKVLIVGGENLSGMVSQAEIVDPVSQTSSLVAASTTARTDHTATRLSDGRVLVTGGRDQSGSLTSSDIYNPLTATFIAGPSLTTPRSGHTATVLADGKILIAGGDAGGSAELYNPATEIFSLIAGSMNAVRKFHSAILTTSGQVLIVGGINAQNAVLNTAEVFNPASQSFYLPPTDMQTPRALATLKLLADGKVQIIGGDAEFSMEVFDPTNGIFIAKALLPPNASLLSATLSTQSRAALFSPLVVQDPILQGVMTPEQSALLDRADQSITELPSRNQALVAGGVNSAGQILNSAKLVSSSKASVTTDKTDYAPGQIVTITGSGFQPNEQVDIYFHEFPEEYPDIFLSAVANQQGNFVVAEFAPQEIDLGRIFTLTAIGQTSGFTAQTAFKDAKSTSISIASSSNPSTVGQSVTFTATVTETAGGGGTAGAVVTVGSVTFREGGNSCSQGQGTAFATSVALNASGQATATKTFTTSGDVTIRACYNGTGGSTGTNNSDASLTQNVVAATATTTTVTSSANPSAYGQSVTFTASVKVGATAVTSGSVTFIEGGTCAAPTTTLAGPTALNVSGQGSFSTSTLTVSLHTITACYGGAAGFNSSNGSVTQTVNAAATTTTISAPLITYNANGSVTVTVSSTAGTPTGNVTLAVDGGTPVSKALSSGSATFTNTDIAALSSPSAGDHTLSASYAAQGTFTASSATGNLHVNQASSTTAVAFEAGPYTYRGTAFTATANVTGVGGLNQTVAVVYSGDCTNVTSMNGCTATADFAGDANHTSSSDTKSITIEKASSTTAVAFEAGPYTYRGTAFTATANVTGVGGLNQTVAVVYSGDCTNVTSMNGCTATADFAGDANHTSSSDTKSITIEKASSTTAVAFEAGPYTYRGTAFTATANVTGVGGLNQTVAVVYSGDCTNVTSMNGCTATADFAGDANHTSSSDTKSITIEKASSTTAVAFEAGPYTYRGTAFTATANVTGVGGLNQTVAVVYSGDCTNVTSMNGCTATADFAGDANHTSSSDTKSITIEKASSTTAVAFEAGPYTYRGTAFTATANVTGVGGLNQTVAVVYSGDCTNVTSMNGCTATANFAGDANHTSSSDTKSITITKASSTTLVTFEAGPYMYRGTAFTATANVTGVGGLNQTVAVVYSGDCTNVTSMNGCTATANFAGDANHTNSSDTKSITITKASSTTLVTFEAGPYMYRGTAFTATANVTGVGGLNQTVAVVYSGDCTNVTSTNGCTATANFAGDANHTNSSDTKSITITTGFAFNGFYSPIGGSVENYTGGSYADPLRSFKLGSTIPVKFGATWLNGGAALITGIHTLQAIKYSSATDSDPAIDATPTDAATTGNQFRLTSPDWHFNLSTKGSGFSAGTWLLIATLQDGSKHSVWITIKK